MMLRLIIIIYLLVMCGAIIRYLPQGILINKLFTVFMVLGTVTAICAIIHAELSERGYSDKNKGI